MTRKDYELIAYWLNNSIDEVTAHYSDPGNRDIVADAYFTFIEALAGAFESDNSRFDKKRFIDAATRSD